MANVISQTANITKKTSKTQNHKAASQEEAEDSLDKEEILPISVWSPPNIDIRFHKEFTENRTRQVLAYSIIAIFVIWILLSLFYFMFTASNDLLTTMRQSGQDMVLISLGDFEKRFLRVQVFAIALGFFIQPINSLVNDSRLY